MHVPSHPHPDADAAPPTAPFGARGRPMHPARRGLGTALAAGIVMTALAGCGGLGFNTDAGALTPDDPGLGDPVTIDDPVLDNTDADAAVLAGAHAFTDGTGLESQYLVFSPPASAAPLGLILHFHGDGGGQYFEPSSPDALGGPEGIVEQGISRGYLVVSVLAPDDDGSYTWWGDDGAANANYVHELLQQLERDYPIDASNIWLVGYSGGAQFITQNFLPAYPDDLAGGGAVLFGGGGSPEFAADFSPALTESFRMFWCSGLDDVADPLWGNYSGLDQAVEGKVWYEQHGFVTDAVYPADTGHDLSGLFGPILGEQLDAAALPSKGD